MHKNKLILIIGFVLMTAMSFAQKPNTERGIFFLKGGSNLQFSLEDRKPFSVQLGIGYFPLKNFLAGVDAGYEKAGEFDDFYARPFARYYIARRFFLGAGLYSEKTGDDIQFIPNVEAGVALFIDSFIAFEPTVVYRIEEDAKPFFAINVSIFYSKF